MQQSRFKSVPALVKTIGTGFSGADMDTVGDVLELLHGARDRFSSVQATVRVWHRVERLNEALSRWARTQTPGSVSLLTAKDNGSRRREDTVYEQTSCRWLQKPSRSRYEVDMEHSEGTIVRIVDGPLWWTYGPQRGAQTNEGAGQAHQGKSSVGHYAFSELFDPSGIIPSISIEAVGRSTQAAREAIVVRALSPETDHRPPKLWPGADQYELHVDAERGVLLRAAARMDGEEFAFKEITSVVFDETLPDELFTFKPPPGVKVRVVGPGQPLLPKGLFRRKRGRLWRRSRRA